MKYAQKNLYYTNIEFGVGICAYTAMNFPEKAEVTFGSKFNQEFIGGNTPTEFLNKIFDGSLKGYVLVKSSKVEKVPYTEEPEFRVDPEKIIKNQDELMDYLKKESSTVMVYKGKTSLPTKNHGDHNHFYYI